ncbi:Hpt domain-containing protein [uncultured Desulfobulbus sp.]|uniref:Hpt domain-containing protein n=1 Tax=uncultured Desulfobulbus sp. TaxID=239745 RepID=UPI0029C6B657|nr:Hpt domain-containing protein [uncultured Desulfobulbus sp.]
MADLHWNKAFALEQTAGDEELLEELLVLFRDSSVSDYTQLQQAVAAGDAAGVVRAAHSLKGAAASLGIEGIRQVASHMEADGRNNSVVVAREQLTAMGDLLEQLKNL